MYKEIFMVKRTISALIALPLLFFVMLKGGDILYGSVLIVSLIGVWEYYHAFEQKEYKPLKKYGLLFITLFFTFFRLGLSMEYLMFLCFSAVFIGMAIVTFYKKLNIVDFAITVSGIVYVAFFFFYIVLIKKYDSNFFIWYVFILAWITDTSAYFAGVFFGKHKLIPEISPKKTVEGAVGGIIGATIVSVAYAYMFNPSFLYWSILLGIVGSVLSQIGDLIASGVKRYLGIKDYGNIMPGHGGVLDGFDSILITTPIVYYFMRIFLSCS
jgi:phosphatidate cytidylyltransferase